MVWNMCHILDVQPETRKWIAIVQIIERHRVSLSHSDRFPVGKKYRRHVATDSQGTRVSIVVYEPYIRFYARSLLPYRRYRISNAYVSQSGGLFRVPDYEFSWTVNGNVLVEEIEEAIIPRLPCFFAFTNFSDLFRFADRDIEINVRALVVHAFPSREISNRSMRREFVIVDEEKRPMIVSIWSDIELDDCNQIASIIEEAPLIVALRFKVTTFYSLSLSSRMSSYIMLSPPLVNEDELRTWYADNEQEVHHLIEEGSYKNPTTLLPYPPVEDIIDIHTALSSLSQVRTAWISGELHLIEGSMKRWYTACSHCQKAIDAEPDWFIKCPSCNQDAEIEVRCCIPVILRDDNSELNAILFSPDAELLTPFNGDDIRQADESKTDLQQELAAAINGRKVVCFVKYFDRDFQLQTFRKYMIIKAHPRVVIESEEDYIVSPTRSPQQNPVVTPLASTEPVHENDFFSPTTKKVLEAITPDPGSTSTGFGSPSRVKRSLRYSRACVLSDEDDVVEESQPVNETGIQSPLKKNKDIWD